MDKAWHKKYKTEIKKYNQDHYQTEIEALKKIIGTPLSDKFTMDMYIALVNGRKITPKMLQAIRKIILRNSPEFRAKVTIEAKRLIPKLNKIRYSLVRCGYTEHYERNSEYFLDSISDISLTDTRPIFTAPNLVAQANPDFLRANVNSAVRETIGANPSIRDYQVIYDFAKTEIERLSAAYTESQKIYEQARVDVASQQMADAQAGTEQEFYLLPSQMSNQDVSAAFQVGLDEFVFNYFKPLIDQGKQNMAYQQGLGVAIASLTR